jgi:YVTN family beta-propeller protein
MPAPGLIRAARAAAALVLSFAAFAATAQVLGPRYTVGANPVAVAVNPVTNKVYVANSDSDTVTVVNAETGATATIAVGDRPFWVAVNVDSNTVYVANRNSSNVTIIDGATDTVAGTAASGGSGWIAVSPFVDKAFVIRNGTSGEVSVIEGASYELTSATRSQGPVGLAVNPVTNRLYVAHAMTGDVAAMDMTTSQSFPPLLCPDGSGGFRPQPAPPPAPHNLPCIDVPGTPVALAVNPATNLIYVVSDGVADRIAVIDGNNHTHVTLTPAGVSGGARAVAVNPVTNRIYAAFANSLVEIDGVSNAMTVLPSGSGGGGPVGVAVDVNSNVVYVPNADGTLLTYRPGNAPTTSGIPPGARAVAVNPITDVVYVLDAGGLQAVTGLAVTASSTFSLSVSPLPGNSGAGTGTIAINASSAMTTLAPLNTIRKVYYRIGTGGPWREAIGTGPYPAHYSGLAPGAYTLQAYATNGLDGPSIHTDFAAAPVTSNIVSYSFTVGTAAPNPARVANLSARGMVFTGDDRMIAGFVVSGSSAKRVAVVATGPSLSQFGIGNPLPNPMITIVRSSDQQVVTINDQWQSNPNAQQLQAAGLAPPHPLEAGILIDLQPGAYTAIVQDASGASGMSVVAVYEVEDFEVSLANLSTRGRVGAGNEVLIGGFIVTGEAPQTVAVVGTGPSLSAYGIANVLADPVLTLVRSSDQAVIAANDNWTAATNAAQLLDTGFAPPSMLEPAILVTLPPGAYTAILSGSGGGTGVGIVAVYAVK